MVSVPTTVMARNTNCIYKKSVSHPILWFMIPDDSIYIINIYIKSLLFRVIPSGYLTQLLNMDHLQLIYLLKVVIIHSFVSLPEGNCSISPLFFASPSAKIQGAIVRLVVSTHHLTSKHVGVGMFYTKKTSYNDNAIRKTSTAIHVVRMHVRTRAD